MVTSEEWEHWTVNNWWVVCYTRSLLAQSKVFMGSYTDPAVFEIQEMTLLQHRASTVQQCHGQRLHMPHCIGMLLFLLDYGCHCANWTKALVTKNLSSETLNCGDFTWIDLDSNMSLVSLTSTSLKLNPGFCLFWSNTDLTWSYRVLSDLYLGLELIVHNNNKISMQILW